MDKSVHVEVQVQVQAVHSVFRCSLLVSRQKPVMRHQQNGWLQEASLREARAMRALKGRRRLARGVSPGKVHPRKTALKGRRRLLRPFRALSGTAVLSRAHALGLAVAPLQGSVSQPSNPYRIQDKFRFSISPGQQSSFESHRQWPWFTVTELYCVRKGITGLR